MKCSLNKEKLTLYLGDVKELVATRNILNIGRNVRHDVEIKYASTSRHEWKVVERTMPATQFEEDDIVAVFREIVKAQTWRPKRLKVFVNPSCGKNNGRKIYFQEVEPIFKMANIETEVIVTSLGNEARENLVGNTLDGIDGVICVGGDGTFWTVASGVLERTQLDAGIDMNVENQVPTNPKVRLGAIHGGSNCCVAIDSVGTASPATSALHIALGYSHRRDVMTVRDADTNQFIGYATVWVFIMDGTTKTMKIDESLRPVFGPARYLPGIILQRILGNHNRQFKYNARMSLGGTPEGDCFRNCVACNPNELSDHLSDIDGGVIQHTGCAGLLTLSKGKCVTCTMPRGSYLFAHVADGTMNLSNYMHSSFWKALIGMCFVIIFNKERDVYKAILKSVNYRQKYVRSAELDFSDSEVVPDLLLDGEKSPHLTSHQVKRVEVNVQRHLITVFGAGSDGTIEAWRGKPNWFDVPYLRKGFLGIIAGVFIYLLSKYLT